jgi:erythronate-4-phosphate dehydrogenase
VKIVVDRDIPFLRGVLEPFAEVVYLAGEAIGADDVRYADALLVRTRTCCDATLLEESRVRFIGTATIGFDHIDREWCVQHGILVATAAGSNRRGVLQWVSAALAWLVSERSMGSPSQLTLGVVGVGNVGSLVKEYAEEWGFRMMCSDPPRERAEGLGRAEDFYPLAELAEESDIITLHVPLTITGPDATRHLVDSAFLAATKPQAVILNSSRGAIIDPDALKGALVEKFPSCGGVEVKGRRGGFIIDTWNDEPCIDRTVLQRTLLATPHIAGYSTQGKATATAMIVNALAHEFGLPLDDWYPWGALRSTPRAISWDEMCRTMPAYFDITAQSRALKAAPEEFEQMRNNYKYRAEYF